MILNDYINTEGFPFDRYFSSANQYAAAQKYWIDVLRAARGFKEDLWRPVAKPVNLEDDMYIGLLVDIENVSERKSIKIHATSILGYARFILNEDLETIKLMEGEVTRSENATPVKGLVKTLDEAMEVSRKKMAETGGFEAGVDQRDFYLEEMEGTLGDPYVYGELLSIISIIDQNSELKALQALELFLQPGAAKERVNSVFVPSES